MICTKKYSIFVVKAKYTALLNIPFDLHQNFSIACEIERNIDGTMIFCLNLAKFGNPFTRRLISMYVYPYIYIYPYNLIDIYIHFFF